MGSIFFNYLHSILYQILKKGEKQVDDEILRVEVRILKTFYGINYKMIADRLGVQ